MADYYAKMYERRAQLSSKQPPSAQKEQLPPTPPPIEEKRTLASREESQVKAVERKPLEQVGNKANEITERVKELDSVSERIKNILSHKRTPSQAATETPQPALQTTTPRKTTPNIDSVLQQQMTRFEIKEEISKAVPFSYSQPDYSTITYKPTATDNPSAVKPKLPSSEDNFNIEDYRRKYLKDKETPTTPTPVQPILPLAPPLTKIQSKNESFTPLCLNLPPLAKQSSQEGSEVDKLIALLCKQVQLDQKLRQLREKFDGFKSKEKWQLLKEQLQRRNKPIQEGEIEKWVEMHEEEFDPFAEDTKITAFPYPELADCLLNAKQHWENARQSLQTHKLEQQGFNLRQLDLDRKGHLTVSDLACFLNSQTGSNLRSRDLFALSLRLCRSPSSPPKLAFESVLSFLAR